MITHARRHLHTRTRYRRWLHVLAWASGVFAALAPVYALRLVMDPQALPVGAVEIMGQFRHIDTQLLSARAAALTTGSFLMLDVGAVKAGLLEVPWVANADVRRVWPDRIHIRVEEHQAIARWGSDSLLSNKGVVFKAPITEFANQLVWLNGPMGSASEVYARYRRAQDLLAPIDKAIRSFSLSERRAWSFEVVDGPEIMVGRADFDHRVSRWVDSFATAIAAPEVRVEQVDLRYTNGFSVRFAAPVDVLRPDPTATAASLSR